MVGSRKLGSVTSAALALPTGRSAIHHLPSVPSTRTVRASINWATPVIRRSRGPRPLHVPALAQDLHPPLLRVGAREVGGQALAATWGRLSSTAMASGER